MGKRYIDGSQTTAFDSYECDNCGESALVLAGAYPAGWKEEYEYVNLSQQEGIWTCPNCKKE